MTLTPHRTIIIVFCSFGFLFGLHLGALPVLIERSSVNDWQFGAAGGIAMTFGLIGASLGGVISHRIDHRAMLLMIIPLCGLALLFALLVTSATAFMVSFAFIALTMSIMDLFMNAEASIVEESEGRKVFSGYHGAASLGMAAAAISGSMVAVHLAPWFNIVLAIVPIMLAWAAVYKTVPHRTNEHNTMNAQSASLPKRILAIIGIAAGFNVACEVAAMHWAGQLLKETAPELAAISGLGLAFYGVCGGLTRIAGDRLREAFGDLRVMSISLFIAICGFGGLGLSPGFWFSVLAFAAVGCGLGIIFPCLYSLAARLAPNARAAAMSFVSIISSIPRIALPWALGAIAQVSNINVVFGTCAVVALLALVLIVISYGKAQAMAKT
jgi:MFS family permease